MKGSGATPRDSSKLKVEVLLEALLVQYKCGHTQTIYEQCKAMQDIREIELRDSGSNSNIRICFEVRATALRPRLHIDGFPLCPHRTSTEELQLNTESTQLPSQYKQLYTRGKAQSLAQSKEEIKLGDTMITNSLLTISKDHK